MYNNPLLILSNRDSFEVPKCLENPLGYAGRNQVNARGPIRYDMESDGPIP